MILESLQSANSTILDSVQATNNKQAAKAFKDQVIALSQYTSQLEQLLNLIKAMQEKKISSKVFTVEIKDSLQDAVDTCGQKTNEHTLDVSAVTALKSSIELCRKNVDITWKEAAQAALEAGADAITLHARTRAQGYAGVANWEILKELVDYVRSSSRVVPVFGSGDAFTPEDCARMIETTDCDAVMFARGAMGNPFIFKQTRQFLIEGRYDDIPAKERIDAGFKQLDTLLEESKDGSEEWACREMRKAFCAYSKGIPGGNKLRAKIVSACSRKDYKDIFQFA